MTTEQYSIGYDAGYQDGFDAVLAEPVKQEPVAVVDEIGKRLDGTNIFNAVGKVEVGQPLYVAPVSAKREWVELTDDEVDKLLDRAWDVRLPLPEFARTVIAAFKEKNR